MPAPAGILASQRKSSTSSPARRLLGLFDKWHCRAGLKDAIFRGMSITATVEQGKIVLPANVDWPSGTVVRIEPVVDQPPTLWETLKDFDGIANDLPADLADNLDHYVHGHARP